MEKYKNKYRIQSARLQTWHYGSAARYFITICTHHRIWFFGNIIDRQMHLSETGKIVYAEWLKTFELRQDMNLYMGEFVVMPNHFHAIIGIGENPYNNHGYAMHGVSTTIQTNETTKPANKFGPQSKNLASIIRGFKSAVTMSAREIYPGFQWQSRFHDHIIRNDDSFHRITNYIINNPSNWKEDKFFGTENYEGHCDMF